MYMHESCMKPAAFHHHNGNSLQMLDIKHYACSGESITDDGKHQLMENREPEICFKFSPKHAICNEDIKDRYVSRYCSRVWFRKFDFISYSKSENGLYCLAFVLMYLIVAPRN